MARFLIFCGAVMVLLAIGTAIWWIGSCVHLSIKKRQAEFSVNETACKEAKRQILKSMRGDGSNEE